MKRLITCLLLALSFSFLIISCSTESTPVYTLSTSVNGEGIITPSGGEYDEGEAVTLTADPAENWLFNNWSGDGSGSSSTVTITMDGDKLVTSTFKRIDYPLTITIEGEGDVEQRVVSSPKTTEYPYEAVVELTSVPHSDWEFLEWGDALSGSENPVQMTITEPVNVLAVFNTIPTVSTDPIESVTEESAQGGGNVTDDGGANVTARGVCRSTFQNPDTTDDCTSDGSGIGNFESSITNLEPATTYNLRAYATNSAGTGYGQQEEFTTVDNDGGNGQPGAGVIDIDGNSYPTVIIGNQEWMAENLRVAHYNNGEAITTDWSAMREEGAYGIYPYSDIDGLNSDAEVVEAYGKLYDWYAVDDDRGLCPTGWRVPSDEDWDVLVDYLFDQGHQGDPHAGSANGAGNALKSCSRVDHPDGGECDTSEHPRWNSHHTHSGFDAYGFSAFPVDFMLLLITKMNTKILVITVTGGRLQKAIDMAQEV